MDIHLEVGLFDHMIVLFLILWGTFILLSLMAVAVEVPNSIYMISLYCTYLPVLVIFCLFDNCHSNKSRSWWWTGRPGMLRFRGAQRVRQDWATELNWTEILTNVRWQVFVIFICISLMISDAEHLFMYLLTIFVSSLEKYLFRSFVYFLKNLFIF